MLSVLVVIAACAGETTAPDVPFSPTTPAAPHAPLGFRVLPGTVTIETNQRIRFRGEMRMVRGQVSAPKLSWEASGGSIDTLGNFSAPTPGTYRVIGRGHGRGRAHPHRPDTSVVVVVRRRPGLIGISVTPRAPQLAPGESRTFTALGQLANGNTAAIGVNWAATGGTIDPAGVYQAGSTAGEYLVIATNTRGTVADTVRVRISVPEIPDTIPGPTPDPTPALARVVLKPATVFLATQAAHQFAAFGRNSVGDSVAIDVAFQATGGTITSTGLYTAGQTAGSYRVIASSSELADTALVTLARTSGGGTPPADHLRLGISAPPDIPLPNPVSFNLVGVNPNNIVQVLTGLARNGHRAVLNMTGGAARNYRSMIDGVDQFDRAKWSARLRSFDTPTIRAAVQQAHAAGVIIGVSVMDEPGNINRYPGPGKTDPSGNYKGPPGTMTRVRVDSLCTEGRELFPMLAWGVVQDPRHFDTSGTYRSCEWNMAQYRLKKDEVTVFRDKVLAEARRNGGMAVLFSLNVLHGGTPGTTCEKYGDDPRGTLCPMSPEQIREFGSLLGPNSCGGLMMWRYERAYIENSAIQSALRNVAESLARLPGKPCTRS